MLAGMCVGMGFYSGITHLVDYFGGPWDVPGITLDGAICIGCVLIFMILSLLFILYCAKLVIKLYPMKMVEDVIE